MTIPPSSGPTGPGNLPPFGDGGLPPSMGGASGPLPPVNSAFVQAVARMFQNAGQMSDPLLMQQVAGKLEQSMAQMINQQIQQDEKLSRERRKEDLRRILGED